MTSVHWWVNDSATTELTTTVMVKVWGFAANVVLTLSNRTHGESFAASRSFCHRAEFFCRQKELSHCSSVCRLFLRQSSQSGRAAAARWGADWKIRVLKCILFIILPFVLILYCFKVRFSTDVQLIFFSFLNDSFTCANVPLENVENHFFLVHHQRMQVNFKKKKSCGGNIMQTIGFRSAKSSGSVTAGSVKPKYLCWETLQRCAAERLQHSSEQKPVQMFTWYGWVFAHDVTLRNLCIALFIYLL